MNRENNKVFKVIIIGGGMSGLVSACQLSKRFLGEEIAIIEKLPRVGKKILSTGNGQCNLTNENITLSNYHGKDVEFAKYSLENFDKNSLINFFEELGIKLCVDNGKYYPLSKQANSVLDALRFNLLAKGVNIFTEEKVTNVSKKEVFLVETDKNNKYFAKNVIVSVGGKSAKHLGTDGSSYSLLEKFGHKTTSLYPSLVQLKCDTSLIKGLRGLKSQVELYATTSSKTSNKIKGELLFTDYGLSGNAIFTISSQLAGEKDAKVYVDFCPSMTSGELIDFLTKKIQNCSYLNAENLLSGIVPNKMALRFLINNGINPENPLDKNSVEKVVNFLKSTCYKITGDTGFDNSQVTHGGIITSDFDSTTMQSNLVKGLYAIGEVLDIDGDCGGYNLQWAYSSAMTACKDIKWTNFQT